jgi:hypothetical protein
MTSRAPITACASVPIGAPVSIAGACALASAPKTLRPNITNVYAESRSFFSNEINLISTWDSPLQWILGLYQYQENSKQPGQQQYLRSEPLANTYLDPVLGVVQNPNRMLQYFANTSLFNAYGAYGQIDYSLNAIPFGGFVRILGQDDFAIRQAGEGQPGSFTSKPWWSQAIVLAAGVTMNMVLALFVLTIAFATGTTASTGDVRVRAPKLQRRQRRPSAMVHAPRGFS